ncbi:hypothetical protein ACFX13_010593 [Malus domestica]
MFSCRNPSQLMILHAMNTEDFKSFSKVSFAGHTEVAYVRAIFALSKPLMHFSDAISITEECGNAKAVKPNTSQDNVYVDRLVDKHYACW